jgi:transcriptional regulator with XRE-family HTH domain
MTLHGYLQIKRITRDEFATHMRCTRQAVGNWINGTRTPTPEMIRRIHAATKGKVSRRDFVDEFGSPLIREDNIL